MTERDERSRLRGRTYVHSSCATYEVRSLSAIGVCPSHPSRGIPSVGSLAE